MDDMKTFEMKTFERIEETALGELGIALRYVRLAEDAENTRTESRKQRWIAPIVGLILSATWYALLFFGGRWLAGTQADIALVLRVVLVANGVVPPTILLAAMLWPRQFVAVPKLPEVRAQTDDQIPWSTALVFAWLLVIALPTLCALVASIIVCESVVDPEVSDVARELADDPEGAERNGPSVRAGRILGDERAKVLSSLARQIRDWNEAIVHVNRVILMAQHGLHCLTEQERELIKATTSKEATLRGLIAVGHGLAAEGPIGTRPSGTRADDETLARLGEETEKTGEQMAGLRDGAGRMIAGLETASAKRP